MTKGRYRCGKTSNAVDCPAPALHGCGVNTFGRQPSFAHFFRGEPSSHRVDALLDERKELTANLPGLAEFRLAPTFKISRRKRRHACPNTSPWLSARDEPVAVEG